MLPDLENFEAHCAVLERLASAYPEDSPERAAIYAAAHAMHFASQAETRAKFREWVASWTKPPTALEVLWAKLAGVEDLPHELLDDTLREVERLMEKLRQARA
jgi:hypothetical protein